MSGLTPERLTELRGEVEREDSGYIELTTSTVFALLDEIDRLRAVVGSLRDRADEIEGTSITLADGTCIRIHTDDQVDAWLRDTNPTSTTTGDPS